jgi:tetratricopeptide (TPR) repeat protein
VGSRRARRWTAAGLVAIVGVYAALYARATRFEFVWDDVPQVARNPLLEGPLAAGLRATQHDHLDPSLRASAGHTSPHESYRPALFVSHRLDVALFGRRPGPMHLHNLLLGALGIAASWWLARRALGDGRLALLPAAVYALHPLQSEPFCYVSGRADLAAGLFALTSAGAALAATDARGSGRRAAVVAGACVAYAVALGFKESAVGVPAAVALLLAARGRLRSGVPALAALTATLLAYAGARLALVGGGATGVDSGIGSGALLALPVWSARYLALAIAPHDLSIARSAAPVTGVLVVAGWVAALGGAALFGLRVARAERRQPDDTALALAGLGVAVVFLAPAMPAVLSTGIAADRYAHLALVGVGLAAAAGGREIAHRGWLDPRLLAVAAMAWLALLAAVTARQVPVWRNNETLYGHAVATAPESASGHYLAGTLALKKHRDGEALHHLQRAVSLDPADFRSANNLGVVYRRLGRLEDAERVTRHAIETSGGRHYRAWNNLGAVLVQRGRVGDGCAALARALHLNPAYRVAHENRARWCTSEAGEPAA